MKFNKSDIQVNGNSVSVKQQTRGDNYNWVCVAVFHHNSNVNLDPNKMAKDFAESITVDT